MVSSSSRSVEMNVALAILAGCSMSHCTVANPLHLHSYSCHMSKNASIGLDIIDPHSKGEEMRPYLMILPVLVALTSNASAQTKLVSMYTSLSGNTCSEFVDDEATGASTLECSGIHDFRLQVLMDDERSSINVVTPHKQVLPLHYRDVVTRGFSTVGKKAEWRVSKEGRKIIPVALIVRVDTLDQSNPGPPKRVPMLAIARISDETACVTRIIGADTRNARQQARRFADNEHLPCLPR